MKKTLLFFIFFYSLTLLAQNSGDFRTKFASGFTLNWHNASSWETFNGITWVSATNTPDFNSGIISIRDTITNFNSITIDEVVVEDGGFIRSYAELTLNSGSGDELIFNANAGLMLFLPLKGTNTSSNIKINSGSSVTIYYGNFDHLVTTHIAQGGILVILPNQGFYHSGTINNYGTIEWKNQKTISSLDSIGTINNYNLFKINSFNYSGNPFESHNLSQQVLNNYGTIEISGGTARISFSEFGSNPNALSHFNNFGIINLTQGKINITQEAYLKGTINISQGSSFKLSAYKYNSVFANHVFDSITIHGLGDTYYEGNVQLTSKNSWLKEDSSQIKINDITGPGILFLKCRFAAYDVQKMLSGSVINQKGGNMYIENYITRTINGILENKGKLYSKQGGLNHGTGDFINKGTIILENMSSNFNFNGPKFTNFDSIICNDPNYYLILDSEFEQKPTGVLQILKGTPRVNSTVTSIDGKVFIASGSSLTATTPGLNFKGDTFHCDGSVRFGFINFNGTSKQFIQGSGEIRNAKVDNSNNLELSSDFSVFLELNLAQGKVILNQYNLHLKNPSSLTATKSNYIVTNGLGRLKSPVNNANTVFYIGTANSAFPVTLSNIGTMDNFSVRVMPNLYSKIDTVNGVGSESQVTEKGINATWFISEDISGGSNVTVQLSYLPSAILPGYDSTESRVLHFTNDKWSESPSIGSVYRGDGFRSVSRFGIKHFSPFAIWSGAFSALPVDLVEFKAFLDKENIELTWQTVTEINNSGFEVYRRLEGELEFTNIGEVQGAGNSNQLIKYMFTDTKTSLIQGNLVYYKLKQKDFNGNYTFSSIQVVNMEDISSTKTMKVYPNPAQNQVLVHWEQYPEVNQFRLLDRTGKVLYAKEIQAGKKEEFLLLEAYESGLYYIEISGVKFSKVVKLVKN